MSAAPRLPVTVLPGCLGAGKALLPNRALKGEGQRAGARRPAGPARSLSDLAARDGGLGAPG